MTTTQKMDDEDILTLIGRYGFAKAHCHTSEQDIAWNKIVAALRQLKADAYQEGFSAGACGGDD